MVFHHQKTLVLIDTQLEQMQQDVFEAPPPDWAAFQRLVGRYGALRDLKVQLEEAARKEYEDG